VINISGYKMEIKNSDRLIKLGASQWAVFKTANMG